jgi:hypothetical protein
VRACRTARVLTGYSRALKWYSKRTQRVLKGCSQGFHRVLKGYSNNGFSKGTKRCYSRVLRGYRYYGVLAPAAAVRTDARACTGTERYSQGTLSALAGYAHGTVQSAEHARLPRILIAVFVGRCGQCTWVVRASPEYSLASPRGQLRAGHRDTVSRTPECRRSRVALWGTHSVRVVRASRASVSGPDGIAPFGRCRAALGGGRFRARMQGSRTATVAATPARRAPGRSSRWPRAKGQPPSTAGCSITLGRIVPTRAAASSTSSTSTSTPTRRVSASPTGGHCAPVHRRPARVRRSTLLPRRAASLARPRWPSQRSLAHAGVQSLSCGTMGYLQRTTRGTPGVVCQSGRVFPRRRGADGPHNAWQSTAPPRGIELWV